MENAPVPASSGGAGEPVGIDRAVAIADAEGMLPGYELAIPLDETAPGPVLRETGEIAAALLDLDAVKREHAAARDAFAASYCALDDGAAAARVVDAVF
jgi:CDP-glycerol glycerophosphotransferase (TagB/SpsB family)